MSPVRRWRRPSRAARRVRAWFGLHGRVRHKPPDASAAAAALDERLGAGRVALITGPSGGGKSLLLRALASRLRRRGEPAANVDPSALPAGRTVIDLIARGGDADGALATLARAGLAEAPLLLRTAAALSDGERWRLALARALGELPDHRGTLLIDEFASILDRPTAAALARALRRLASRAGVRIACATAHDDILEPLAPDLLVTVAHGGTTRVVQRELGRQRSRRARQRCADYAASDRADQEAGPERVLERRSGSGCFNSSGCRT